MDATRPCDPWRVHSRSLLRLGYRARSADDIERLDVPVRRPRQSAQEIANRIAALPAYVQRNSLIWWQHMTDLVRRNMWNKVDIEPWGAFPTQVYLEGLYRLGEDEALILETDVPKVCRYWSFLVGDMQFRTNDWANNQTSINGFQARLDTDGRFRAVIANRDPGVPNWLDTSGFHEGVIQIRWNRADSAPIPTSQVVKIANLREHLPQNTPVVTPQERDGQLRERRYGYQLRRKW